MPSVEGGDLQIVKDCLVIYFQREEIADLALVEGLVYVARVTCGLLQAPVTEAAGVVGVCV